MNIIKQLEKEIKKLQDGSKGAGDKQLKRLIQENKDLNEKLQEISAEMAKIRDQNAEYWELIT